MSLGLPISSLFHARQYQDRIETRHHSLEKCGSIHYPLPLRSTQRRIPRVCLGTGRPQELPLDAAQPQMQVLLAGAAAVAGLQGLLQTLQNVHAAQAQHGAAHAQGVHLLLHLLGLVLCNKPKEGGRRTVWDCVCVWWLA